MSHFTVLVIGQNIDQQLAPFHEFECTGIDDAYVQDIDTTADELEEFQGATRSMIRLADGSTVSAYDDLCYRNPTEEERKAIGPIAGSGWCGPAGVSYASKDWGDGLGYRTKVHYLPDGAEKFDQGFSSFAAWLQYNHSDNFLVPFGTTADLSDTHKYGYALLDESGAVTKVVRRTNPEKRWDWWQLGGRWSGMLILKNGRAGRNGKPGLMGSHHENRGVDQALKGDVDFDGMRSAAEARAATDFDRIHAIVAGRTFDTWDECRAKSSSIDEARAAYWEQPVLADLTAAKALGFMGNADQYRCDRETYLARGRDSAACTFAVVKDGTWYQRGQMGWWGCVSDEKDESQWASEFTSLIDGLPDDTLLSVVDCHI